MFWNTCNGFDLTRIIGKHGKERFTMVLYMIVVLTLVLVAGCFVGLMVIDERLEKCLDILTEITGEKE